MIPKKNKYLSGIFEGTSTGLPPAESRGGEGGEVGRAPATRAGEVLRVGDTAAAAGTVSFGAGGCASETTDPTAPTIFVAGLGAPSFSFGKGYFTFYSFVHYIQI